MARQVTVPSVSPMPLNEWVGGAVSQTIIWSVNHSVKQLLHPSVICSVSQSDGGSVNQPVSRI